MIPSQKQEPSAARVGPGRAVDAFGRTITYLRVSVTDRCNLRCVYCMPAEGYEWIPRREVLTFEELARLVRVFAGIGVRRLRLTGGEPTVRKDVVELVRMLAAVDGIEDLSMTTNGLRLARLARPLVEAGIRRFNVSIDSLRTDRFAALTRGGNLSDVLDGIDAVLALNLSAPLKLNTVVVGGVNDDEVVGIVRHFQDARIVVRFIEYMPFTDQEGWADGRYVALDSVRASLADAFGIRPIQGDVPGNGPAEYWEIPGRDVRVGFIHPVSDHFCAACNRVRLSADGELRPCLGHVGATSLRDLLRRGATDEQIREAIQGALHVKPERHFFAEDPGQQKGVMTAIGG